MQMAYLMRLAYPELPFEHKMAILDVRKGILYEEIPLSDTVVQKLHREASYWVELAQKYAVLEELA